MQTKRLTFLFLALSLIVMVFSQQQTPVLSASQVVLSDKNIELKIDLQGGAIVDFRRTASTINPFSWKVNATDMPENNRSGAVFQGHFLCTGRWGSPTEGEMKAGVPHNGQASRDVWTVTEKTATSVKMKIKSPLDGIIVERKVSLIEGKNGFQVTESFTNYTSIGRLFNVVQHATIGAPFLNESTSIESNAQKGFMQHLSYPDPNKHAYNWPMAFMAPDADSIDLRRSDSPESYVSTHVFSDSIAWVSATSPAHQLTLVYSWNSADYPWLNVWQQRVDGRLWAKGLEFGTTGIGRSYQDLLRYDTSFNGQNSFVWLDAGEKITKSYSCFLLDTEKRKEMDKESQMIDKARRLIAEMTLEEKVGQMLYDAPAIPRLNIPAYNWWNECLHGVARAGRATVFPQAIGMAAMWDKQQMYRNADAISDEARAKHHFFASQGKRRIYQGLTMWTPNINIFRDPRWGRGMETYGEDPYLTGELAVPFIKGLQGNDPDYYKVIATAKHFVVHSGPESSRHSFDARVDDYDFHTTYLPHFKKTIQKAGVYSVMCAYNRFRGTPCCGDKFLENLLRNDWGFKGYIVSDCWAIKDFYDKGAHEVVNTKAEAAAMAVKAGTDLNCGDTYPALVDAVKQGLISEQEIDVSLERLMLARLKLGILPADSLSPWSTIPISVVNSKKHQQLALESAQKSMVLLQNKKNILPLRSDLKRIAVIGPNAQNVDVLLGNYHGYSDHYVTILEGIKARNPQANVTYAPGCRLADELPLFDVVPTDYLFINEQCTENGLEGEYFASLNHEGNPLMKRVDKQVDFKWWGISPVEGLPTDTFSVRWTGVLLPPVTGNYYLGADGHYAYKLFINDSLVTQFKNTHHNRTEYGTSYLEKGKKYRIRLEYIQDRSENAFVQMLWDIPRPQLLDEAVTLASQSDVVILAMGLSPLLEGEEMKVKVKGFNGGDREELSLPDSQKRLINAISKTGKPVVLVLLNGSAIAFADEAKKVDAVVEAWYPGEAGGTAVASVLWGDHNPAGRLPVTFYKSVADLPAFDDYSMKGRTYRYFNGKTQYDFGFGLSYTTFTYSNLQLSTQLMSDRGIEVKFDITNTGKLDGDEVCQLYIQSKGSKSISLQGFDRVHITKGETKSVTMQLTPEQIEDVTGKKIAELASHEFVLTVAGAKPGGNTQKLQAKFKVD